MNEIPQHTSKRNRNVDRNGLIYKLFHTAAATEAQQIHSCMHLIYYNNNISMHVHVRV